MSAMTESQPPPAHVSKNPRPGFRECIDPFCHAYDAWGTHYHEDVNNVTDHTDATDLIPSIDFWLRDGDVKVSATLEADCSVGITISGDDFECRINIDRDKWDALVKEMHRMLSPISQERPMTQTTLRTAPIPSQDLPAREG